jgi:uncharacterized protein YndB with AHSA1/START domain
MTRVNTTIEIALPVDAVFGYVTTPGTWPEWHPSSLGVTGATDHSLDVGEQCTEAFRVAGRRGSVIWTVRERVAPRRWVISGAIQGSRSGGTITYTLTPRDGGTFFEREFNYTMANVFVALLDRLVLRRRIQAESAEALRRLKRRLGGDVAA